MADYKIDIQTDHERKFVRVAVEGTIDKAAYIDIATKGFTAAFEHQYPSLWDLRNTKLTVKLVDLYYLTENLEIKQSTIARRLKAAGLVSPEYAKQWGFVETRNINVGFRRKTFFDEKQALDWLLGGGPPSE
jgi:transcriptional antiterminator